MGLLVPRTYTAQASFFSESRSASDLVSGLGGLASLVGSAGGPLGLGPQSAFLVDMFKSQSFVDSLISSRITVDSLGTLQELDSLLVPRARTEPLRHWNARKKVAKRLRVFSLPSGVVVLMVRHRSPYVAASVANTAIRIIDNLNIEFRRRQAASRRQFTQQFLIDVERRRDAVADTLEAFLTTNRIVVSPALQRRQQRLTSEVSRLGALREQLETTIENARLTEFNDAPLVTRIDRASVPERPSDPTPMLLAIGTPFLFLMIAFWAMYLRLWK